MTLKIVAEVFSPDRDRAIRILGRADGLFQWREDFLPEQEDWGLFWREGHPLSGIFASLEEARTAAFEITSWLAPAEQ